MIIFWSIIVVMIVISLAIILRPLLTKQGAENESASDTELNQQQQNIQIARERLVELKSELAQGAIDQGSYEQSRIELESTLLDDIETATTGDVKQEPAARFSLSETVAICDADFLTGSLANLSVTSCLKS